MVFLKGFNPQTGEWNDSLTGNYVWANTNIGETLSGVLTPMTWSLVSASFERMNVLPGHPLVGNIGGRAYNNVSVLATAMRAVGRNLQDLNKEMGGVREEYQDNLQDIMIPIPGASFLSVLGRGLRIKLQERRGVGQIPQFLAGNQDWFREMRRRIEQTKTGVDLADMWLAEIEPYIAQSFWMVVGSAWEYGEVAGRLRRDLTMLVGAVETDLLLSSVSREAELLASLGPAWGLARVARGGLDLETYLEKWGHRGPAESELSAPRPAEDPGWVESQLSALAGALIDAEELLTGKRQQYESAWTRFVRKFPGKAAGYERRLAKAAEAARVREAVRSEQVRLIWIARIWALCVGSVSGLSDDVFYLTKGEAVALMQGRCAAPVEWIPARKKTYARYRELPPYPPFIRGRFDPFQWVADPNHRTDFYDPEGVIARFVQQAEREDPSHSNKILGAPGSAGVVEGVVCRLDSPEEAHKLNKGDILVTVQTNIGWSHLFPLAKAIVTDVGAALSHAAIVAREMGIPAVVNCGDATMRLKTGDRVRVDGGQGVVEILESCDGIH